MKTKYKWYKTGGHNRTHKFIVFRRTSSPETSASNRGRVILLKGGKSK